jgi:hypothetical protein
MAEQVVYSIAVSLRVHDYIDNGDKAQATILLPNKRFRHRRFPKKIEPRFYRGCVLQRTEI